MSISLRSALMVLWLLIVLVCVALGFLMAALFEFGAGGEIKRVQQSVDASCASIARQFTTYDPQSKPAASEPSAEERQRTLDVIADLVLNGYPGVEGGFWDTDAGFVAYSFPTHEGGAPKHDVPESEKGLIVAICRAALDSNHAESRRRDGPTDSLILAARPATHGRLAIWTMSRAHVSVAAAYQRLITGFSLLLVFTLLSGGGLLWFFQRWSHRLENLEVAIVQARSDELPDLPLSGQKELDRLVGALNQTSARLRQTRAKSEQLSSELARSMRHAALGRMAAELVHEIRNPVGAMRLRAENALAKGAASQPQALQFIVSEILRLDDLLERLLAIARLNDLARQPVSLRSWLDARLARIADQAARQSVTVRADTPAIEWSFDEKSMSRVLDNLLLNALQHTPAGGAIDVQIAADEHECSISVENTGPLISPENRERIFEAFTTARDTGTGLGLGISREIVEAHGGALRCVDSTVGARFVIILPCAKS